MKEESKFHNLLRWIPRIIGYGAMLALTWFWAFWSFGEMYHEGWWGPWYNRILYLIPAGIALGLTLLVVYFPKIGAWITIGFGVAATVFFWGDDLFSGTFEWQQLGGLLIIGGGFFLFGALFLYEARYRKKRQAAGWTPAFQWWKRNLYTLILVTGTVICAIGFSGYHLPRIAKRVDDGIRTARLIEGNGISLIWAPKGPGWNWQQSWGGYPSWTDITLYGKEPVGFEGKPEQMGTMEDAEQYHLCLYLNEEGTALMAERQDIWRMPTVDELVRSLPAVEGNAGCTWNGRSGEMDCTYTPDKTSPLWALDESPIYYWAYEEDADNERSAYFVSYNGWVNTTYKGGGNTRHSYRCVKDN